MKMRWNEIDDSDQQALIKWYNIHEEDLDADHKKKLAKLFSSGGFRCWDCPNCGKTIRVAQPDDWVHFQGCQQDESLGELCVECTSMYLNLKEYADE
jgi:hypothetical protein